MNNYETDPIINDLIDAFSMMESAASQSHNGHWDKQGTHGRNCPECIRARKLRKEANILFGEILPELIKKMK